MKASRFCQTWPDPWKHVFQLDCFCSNNRLDLRNEANHQRCYSDFADNLSLTNIFIEFTGNLALSRCAELIINQNLTIAKIGHANNLGLWIRRFKLHGNTTWQLRLEMN